MEPICMEQRTLKDIKKKKKHQPYLCSRYNHVNVMKALIPMKEPKLIYPSTRDNFPWCICL